MSNQGDQKTFLINQIICSLDQNIILCNKNSQELDKIHIQSLNLLNSKTITQEIFVKNSIDSLFDKLISLEEIKKNTGKSVQELNNMVLPPTLEIHPLTMQWINNLIQWMANVLYKQDKCGRLMVVYQAQEAWKIKGVSTSVPGALLQLFFTHPKNCEERGVWKTKTSAIFHTYWTQKENSLENGAINIVHRSAFHSEKRVILVQGPC
ncbi:hypothetical protein SCHPADRAFT_980390 [Schizopora paradoxa]|uniref:Uncharacterized protein n=1 Tax=Schizopora paradoxa TaxID=27342 RepID=A0A0H2RBM4_9AGAM|nr:hypothetical protein SCHPADRAFT_980390 [Schizopora paradoxa]